MLFVPKGNKYHIIFSQLNPWERYGLTIGVAVLFIGSWFILLYLRVENFIDTMHLKHNNEQAMYKRGQEAMHSIDQLKNSVKELQQRVSIVHRTTTSQDVLLNLIKKLNNAGLQINSIIPEVLSIQEVDEKKKIVITVEASFSKIILFLKNLAVNKDGYTCYEISIRQSGDTQCSVRLVLGYDMCNTTKKTLQLKDKLKG